ncbi:MAG TPA: tetratricopeptide repeat protein, partial [Alphaproteobacteria bacterium]
QEAEDHLAAESAYRRVLQLNPAHYKAVVNLSAVLMALARPHDAFELLQTARNAKPDDPGTARALITAVLYDPEADEATRLLEYQRLERQFARPAYARRRAFANSREPDRRLRIGWISSDFRDHPVARNLEPIFSGCDRTRFEMTCYADVAKPDATTALFQSLAARWRPIMQRTDDEVAELIRSDGIDILVILAGRFDHNRYLIGAYGAAPVQISLFDGGTSGITGVDYIVADPVLVPRQLTEYFTERVVRLPSLYVYPVPPAVPAVAPPPSATTGRITLGSFNNPIKVNDRVVALWAAVMRELPDARLHLKYRNRFAPLRDSLARSLAAEGVTGDRLEVGDRLLDQESHLSLYNDVDVALDTFPFTGSTTTFEALWMGVPVITLVGDHMAARWSASILRAARLDELVATTPREFVEKAVALARDPVRLADLRGQLRERVARSPLCDGRGRARQFERLFRAAWGRWCART